MEYRFTFDPQFKGAGDPFVGPVVSSMELAEGQMNLIANYTLLLHETGLMDEWSNYGFIEERENDSARWEIADED